MERSVGGHAMESSQPCPKGSIRGKMSASEAVYEGCRYNISMLNLAIGRAAVIPKGRNQHKLRALTAAVLLLAMAFLLTLAGAFTAKAAPLTPSTYYFAEGTCRPNFDTYFCIQNPGSAAASVTLNYMKGDGTSAAVDVTVPKNSRVMVSPRDTLGTGDDEAHDFSTRVTSNQPIIVERPMYFNYNGVWTGGSDAVGATALASTYYFAEGKCRPDFDTYFCIQNPGSAAASVTLNYTKGDGTSAAVDVTVPKNSRVTVVPRDTLGTGDEEAHDFSTKVTSSQPVIVERPMYFNYNGVWTGGSDVVGATALASTYYFAEGKCRPNFDTYFCIQNPGSAAASVTLDYMKGDGTSATVDVTVPKNSRVTISPRDTLGEGDDAAHDFSTKVTSSQPVIVERPMYFNYNGVWTGGSDVVGATALASTYYFAEGKCRPNFDTYFCIQNPGSAAASVTLDYMKGDGTSATVDVTVPKNSRVTISPRDTLGEGDDAAHDFSTKVTSSQPVIVERPMYFNYNGVWTGGSTVVGLAGNPVSTLTSISLTSAYVGPAAAIPLTSIGAITGTAQVGQTLTAGALSPSGATASYQWEYSTTPGGTAIFGSTSGTGGTYTAIPGATSSTYTIDPAYVNDYIRL